MGRNVAAVTHERLLLLLHLLLVKERLLDVAEMYSITSERESIHHLG